MIVFVAGLPWSPSTPVMAASNQLRQRFGAFELDEANARLLRGGRPVPLAPKPFTLLCALVRHAGSLLTKNQLLDEVWGHQFVSESVLKTAISELRAALDDDPRQPSFIETVSRRGYRFVAATAAVAAEPPAAAESAADVSRATYFVGRAPELSRLRRAWDLACGGRQMIVFVAGEPGIGKTALIERFAASLPGTLCVRGQCVDHYGAGEPYLPVLEAVSELCRADAALRDVLRDVAPAWLLQLPWLCTPDERDRLRRELAGVGAERMPREIGEFLARCTECRPLLLVTEDLHWSDRATVQLIDHVARRRGTARLMWLASFRLAEVVATDHPLNSVRQELRLHGLCEEIVLDPFSEAEVAACVATRSPSLASDEAFVRSLHDRTDGVPLFVTSVMREIIARTGQDDTRPAKAARLVESAVPDNLAGIVERYVAKLEPEKRELLTAASVVGPELRVTTLAQVLDQDAASVEVTCEALARERLWLVARRAGEGGHHFPDSTYEFSHALFRQVLYERTTPLSRAQLHRKVGEALARERAAGAQVAPAELAMHFERGREPMIALHHYAEAARAALQRLSPQECFDLTERGQALLATVPAGADCVDVEITLATLRGVSAFQLVGVGDHTKAAFDRACGLLSDAPRHPLRGTALHGLGWVLSLRAEFAAALAVAERTERLAAASGDPVLRVAAATAESSVHMLQGRPRQARERIERVLNSVDSLEGEAAQGFAADPMVTLVAMLGLQLLHLGLVVQGRERLEQAADRARRLGQPMARLVVAWYEALFELRLGRADRVKALADEMNSLVDEFSLYLGRAASRWFRGWADSRLGMPREGYDGIQAANAEELRSGMKAAASESLGYAAEALLLTGDTQAAQAALDEALESAADQSERIYLPQLHLLQAAIARARGDRSEAEDAVRRAVAEARAQEAAWLELLALLELCESGYAAAADRRALARLLDRLPETVDTDAARRARALLDA